MDLKTPPAGGVAAMTAVLALPLVRRSGGLLPRLTGLLGEVPLEPRLGRLHGDVTAFEEFVRTLQPLDILLERGPLRLADAFIPGYFKHAAVYLGEAAGGPAGRPVLEARREGVRFSPLPSPRDLDTVAVLRDVDLSPDRSEALISEALGEVGKSYDFRFDGADRQRQFCSKMVAQLFRHLPLGDVSGRRSLVLPDDLARLTLVEPASLCLEAFLLEGKAVPARIRRSRLREVLGAAG
jgi:hypothetical protein